MHQPLQGNAAEGGPAPELQQQEEDSICAADLSDGNDSSSDFENDVDQGSRVNAVQPAVSASAPPTTTERQRSSRRTKWVIDFQRRCARPIYPNITLADGVPRGKGRAPVTRILPPRGFHPPRSPDGDVQSIDGVLSNALALETFYTRPLQASMFDQLLLAARLGQTSDVLVPANADSASTGTEKEVEVTSTRNSGPEIAEDKPDLLGQQPEGMTRIVGVAPESPSTSTLGAALAPHHAESAMSQDVSASLESIRGPVNALHESPPGEPSSVGAVDMEERKVSVSSTTLSEESAVNVETIPSSADSQEPLDFSDASSVISDCSMESVDL